MTNYWLLSLGQTSPSETWSSWGTTLGFATQPVSWRPNTSAWRCTATPAASPPWPKPWVTQQPLLPAWSSMVSDVRLDDCTRRENELKRTFKNVTAPPPPTPFFYFYFYFYRRNHHKGTCGSDDEGYLRAGVGLPEGGRPSLHVQEHPAGVKAEATGGGGCQ